MRDTFRLQFPSRFLSGKFLGNQFFVIEETPCGYKESVCPSKHFQNSKKKCQESYLLDEELDFEVRDGGFKLGGVLLDVATEYSVPVVLVTVDGYTVAVLF